jgi:outer membrane protein assembly factor BamB
MKRRMALGAAVAGLLLVAAAPIPAGAEQAAAAKSRVAWQALLHKGDNSQARSVAIDGDYVSAAGFTTTDKSSPRLTIRTHRLSTGALAWQEVLPGVAVAQQVAAADGIVAVGGFTLSNAQSSGALLRAYDGKTGKLLWKDTAAADRDHQSFVQAVAISKGKVYAAGYIGSCPFFGEPGCTALLTAYDAKTGAKIWEQVSDSAPSPR